MTSKKIRTVLGDVTPEEVGMTLTHEHLSLRFDGMFQTPPAYGDGKETCPFTMENLWFIKQNPYSHKENLFMNTEHDAVIEEMRFFKKSGGSCIVENTTRGIDRQVQYLKKVSEETGVHVIAPSGYYVDAVHPDNMGKLSEEQLCGEMVADITEGVDGTPIKCGVIGELGCSWPLTDNERKVLRSAAYAQKQTGCPVIIHPGRHYDAPAEIIRVLAEAGGNIGKTVMSHLDRTLFSVEQVLEFAALGSYCEYDLFGVEVSHYQNADTDMPSDAQRIQYIKQLIADGRQDKIVIAQDIHTKHRLMKYGGHGYSHILLNVLPKMLARGISQQAVDDIMINNPRRWLQF